MQGTTIKKRMKQHARYNTEEYQHLFYPFGFNFPSSKQLLHSFPKVRDVEVENVVNCAAKLTE